MTRDELITYWLNSSEENRASMINMFTNGEYVWSLFVGHLCIEKLLKAYYVKEVDTVAPRIHDLFKLATRCNLQMSDDQMDSLQYITLFNLEARYEEYKREFHSKCNKNFTQENIQKIEGIRSWLLEKINS